VRWFLHFHFQCGSRGPRSNAADMLAEAQWMRLLTEVDEQLSLLLRIREVLGSSLDTETGCPDRFQWYFSIPPGKCRYNTSNLAKPVPFMPLSVHACVCISVLFAVYWGASYRRCFARWRQLETELVSVYGLLNDVVSRSDRRLTASNDKWKGTWRVIHTWQRQ
jgi:hypothetical protein